MLKNWLNFKISNHMCWHSCNKCAEVADRLKEHVFIFCDSFICPTIAVIIKGNSEIVTFQVCRLKKTLWTHLWMEFNCLKITEPLQGDSLLFSSKCMGVPSAQLNWEGWKVESTLVPHKGFEHKTPWLGIQHPDHWAITPWPRLWRQGWWKIVHLSNQESEGTMSYILGIKWLSGCTEVRYHEMYKKYLQVSPFYGTL